MRGRTGIAALLLLAISIAGGMIEAPARADEVKQTAVPPPPPPEKEEAKGAIVVWPTMTPAGDDSNGAALRRPRETEAVLFTHAQELDATLREAVADLGFTLDVGDAGPTTGHTRDLDLIGRAKHSTPHGGETDPGTWVVSARIESDGDAFIVRILVVAPKSGELRVRVDRVRGADVAARGLVMLRDLLVSTPATPSGARDRVDASAGFGVVAPLRSPGRPILAANGAIFGGFVAYSIQRASGSDDPRLLYPLLALGTGVGLGVTLLAAEEWDVSTGDALYLGGGAAWGAASGILIANGRHVQPLTDRYAWGVGGGLIGSGLAIFAMTRTQMDEGDAALAHSGAGLGLLFGSLANFYYNGSLDGTPYTGAGYGAAIGVIGGGALAVWARVSPSRVVLIDAGAGLGGLAGAALGSPLVFQDLTEGKTRGFLAATAGGALVGGGIAYYLTRNDKPEPVKSTTQFLPNAGVIGQSETRGGPVPIYGAGFRGTF